MSPSGPEHAKVNPVKSKTLRYFLIGLGTFFVALGIIGIFLPLMPTTIFLLGAAACYARASERFYNWLVDHRLFGPPILAWREHRCIPRRSKIIAMISVVVSISISIAVVPVVWVKFLLVGIAASLLTMLWRIPILPEPLEEPATCPIPGVGSNRTEPEPAPEETS